MTKQPTPASPLEKPEPASRLIQAGNVRRLDERVAIRPTTPSSATAPIVDLVRDGHVVREIRFTCPCGQRHILECEYE